MCAKPYCFQEIDKESLLDRKERVGQPLRLSHAEAGFCISPAEGASVWQGNAEATYLRGFRA